MSHCRVRKSRHLSFPSARLIQSKLCHPTYFNIILPAKRLLVTILHIIKQFRCRKIFQTTIITLNDVYDIYSILTFQHGILFLTRFVFSILVSCNAHVTFYRYELISHQFYKVKYRYLTLYLIWSNLRVSEMS